jgi:predicted DCC family thiol-disulfide oxidoreductase YuxK
MHNQRVWLFDSACVLCSGGVRYTLQHEREPLIRFVAIQSDVGRAMARQHGIDPENPDSFLFVDGEKVLKKSDGVLALIKYLNGPARLLLAGRFLPRFLRDWLYDRIARNRYRLFGRMQTCLVPDSAMRQRFVLPDS